jgi:hypothetical protein
MHFAHILLGYLYFYNYLVALTIYSRYKYFTRDVFYDYYFPVCDLPILVLLWLLRKRIFRL